LPEFASDNAGELFNLVAVFHSDRYHEGWDSAGDPDELRKRFQDVVPDVRTMLGKIESWRMWVLCDREPVKNWSKGRVTLLGDAAHTTLQYPAQGACMAIEDAVVLAEELDHASAASLEIRNQFLRDRTPEKARKSVGWLYDGI
jgi:salicylate hydroxylase